MGTRQAGVPLPLALPALRGRLPAKRGQALPFTRGGGLKGALPPLTQGNGLGVLDSTQGREKAGIGPLASRNALASTDARTVHKGGRGNFKNVFDAFTGIHAASLLAQPIAPRRMLAVPGARRLHPPAQGRKAGS